MLGQHVVDIDIVYLFPIVMLVFVIIQSTISMKAKYGLARVVIVTIILGVGLGKLWICCR